MFFGIVIAIATFHDPINAFIAKTAMPVGCIIGIIIGIALAVIFMFEPD